MLKLSVTALAAALMLTLPAASQDAALTVELPEICKGPMPHDVGSMKMDMMGMDQAHQDLATGMDQTNAQMLQGMRAEDIDVGRARAALERAEAAIEAAGDDEVARDAAEAARERAENRLRVGER